MSVFAVLAVLALGAVLNTWVYGQLALRLGNRLLERIPLIKTVYGGVNSGPEQSGLARRHSDPT